MSASVSPSTAREVLEPADVRALPGVEVPPTQDVWVYRYRDAESGWTLSIGTQAEPGSGKLSLGGFRIAPESRTSLPGWTSEREAVGLALGMEEKVFWSRRLHVGGPLARAERGRVVGGKCVLHPTPDARVGQPRDRELLDWAIACFQDFESFSGVFLTTGQDLGHGLMADGEAQSLAYLNARFRGSVLADTSIPTAEGNFHLLHGMVQGAGLALRGATVGLVGAGHIGMHLVKLLRAEGAELLVCEMNPGTRGLLENEGIRTWGADDQGTFATQPMDALVVNAAGGSLDEGTIARLARNDRLQVVCGSENLAMPDASGVATLLAAGKVYCPTELGGMMGYLTAVEEYLAARAGEEFRLETVLEAARRLETVGREVMTRVVAGGYARSFEEVARDWEGA